MKELNLYRIGEKHKTLEGDVVEIVGYRSTYDVNVKLDNGNIFPVQYGHLIRGKVKNPYHPLIFSVGFIGDGKYKTKDGNKHFKSYVTWRNMLERSCSEEYKKKAASYRDTTVCKEWHNYQNFAAWFYENYDLDIMEGWHLDKDILQKGNKIYSPETCCFVPNEVNSFFVKGKSRRGECLIGVSRGYNKFMASCNVSKKVKNLGYFTTELEAFQIYKDFKENLALELAKKWEGKILEGVYNALINYNVEIDD
jgi:hypothetical protein